MTYACAEESVALTVTSKVPDTAGSPLINKEPSASVLKESPSGRLPCVLQVKGPMVPVVGVISCEYGEPTVPSGRELGAMAGADPEKERAVAFAVMVEPSTGVIKVPG